LSIGYRSELLVRWLERSTNWIGLLNDSSVLKFTTSVGRSFHTFPSCQFSIRGTGQLLAPSNSYAAYRETRDWDQYYFTASEWAGNQVVCYQRLN